MIVATGRTFELLEAAALLVPVGFGGDGADLTLGDWGSAVEIGLEEKQLFLKIGGEVAEVHDLAQTCSCDLAGSRQVGLRSEAARCQSVVEMDGDRHQP